MTLPLFSPKQLFQRDFSELKQTAIHEAGHTLIYKLCGFDVEWVKLYPNAKGKKGETKPIHRDTDFDNPNSMKYKLLHDKLMSVFAGYYAELVLSGKENKQGAMDDLDSILVLISDWFDNSEGKLEFLKKAQCDTYNMVFENQKLIMKIANPLEKTLVLNKSEIDNLFSLE
jgi:hypothetical protein